MIEEMYPIGCETVLLDYDRWADLAEQLDGRTPRNFAMALQWLVGAI